MTNDSTAILDDLLSRWHFAGLHTQINGTDRLADPMFNNYRSYRGWDDDNELITNDLLASTIEKIDFAVSGDRKGQGGMQDPHRSAIYILARNCYTGRNVWLNPRLPKDPMERGEIVVQARVILTEKLRAAGVL